ncbi:ribosomal maturation YjgA family protein [Pleurocapsa sp. FMAR1]|uniref:ribosomal maturation YjgA family protein n=1 Tax=Pleurocapsa sp. FMAR1 TaxID=3040204 RepID=UPI0029C8AA2D|nr:DUF2809 domain-containing protein [Pleurocapsa sp. FMAR1]
MNRNVAIFILILIIVPLGLFSKAYTGIGQAWVHDYSGDILYEILWCLVFSWFFPSKRATVIIPVWVFIVTSLIEISQLFFTHVPIALRETIIWKLLLGSTFVWWDFPHYAIGCLLGWLILDRIYYFSYKT